MTAVVPMMELLRAAGLAGGDVVGADPVPHGDDLWVSTDDVLDYARWISRRVNELDARVAEGLRDPMLGATVLPLTLDRPGEPGWISWVTRWRTFAAGLESSWWDRLNAWTQCTTFHNELRAWTDRARAAGVKAPDLVAPPTDQQGLTRMVDDLSSSAALPAMLAIGALVAGAWFLSSAKR